MLKLKVSSHHGNVNLYHRDLEYYSSFQGGYALPIYMTQLIQAPFVIAFIT